MSEQAVFMTVIGLIVLGVCALAVYTDRKTRQEQESCDVLVIDGREARVWVKSISRPVYLCE